MKSTRHWGMWPSCHVEIVEPCWTNLDKVLANVVCTHSLAANHPTGLERNALCSAVVDVQATAARACKSFGLVLPCLFIFNSAFYFQRKGLLDHKICTSVNTCQFHLRCDTSKDHDAPRHLQDFVGLGRSPARSGSSVAPVKSLLAWLSLCCPLAEALPDGPVCVLLHGAIQDS